jgi:uncharacterized membrane protein YdjX (TVP38/TMEM64 family)
MPCKAILTSKLWNWAFLLFLLLVLLYGVSFLPLGEHLEAFEEYLSDHKAMGFVILMVVYLVVSLLAGPILPLQLAAGFAFGLVWGFVAVMIGNGLGALTSFFVGRHMARDCIKRRLNRWPKFQAIDGAIAQKGFQVVLLFRLNPIFPFGIQNYFFSITPVKLRSFISASLIGSIPGTLLYVYVGSIGRDILGRAAYSPIQWALLAAGLIGSALGVWIIARRARNVMRTSGEWGKQAAETQDEIFRSFHSSRMIKKLDV